MTTLDYNSLLVPFQEASMTTMDEPTKKLYNDKVQALITAVLRCPSIHGLLGIACNEGDSRSSKKVPVSVFFDEERCRSNNSAGFNDATKRWIVLNDLKNTERAISVIVSGIIYLADTTTLDFAQDKSCPYKRALAQILEKEQSEKHDVILRQGAKDQIWPNTILAYIKIPHPNSLIN